MLDPARATTLQKRIRRLEGGPYLLRAEVAVLLDITPRRLCRWAQRYPQCRPTRLYVLGGLSAWLYTFEDLERIRTFVAGHHGRGAGHPLYWTPEQRVRRTAIYNLIRYHRRMAARRELSGDTEGVVYARTREAELKAELEAMPQRV